MRPRRSLEGQGGTWPPDMSAMCTGCNRMCCACSSRDSFRLRWDVVCQARGPLSQKDRPGAGLLERVSVRSTCSGRAEVALGFAKYMGAAVETKPCWPGRSLHPWATVLLGLAGLIDMSSYCWGPGQGLEQCCRPVCCEPLQV